MIEASLAQESGGEQTGESLSGEESVSAAAEESVSAAAGESASAAAEESASAAAEESASAAAEESTKAAEENSESAESGSGEESASGEEVKPGIFRSEREFSTDYVYGEFSAIHTEKRPSTTTARRTGRGSPSASTLDTAVPAGRPRRPTAIRTRPPR